MRYRPHRRFLDESLAAMVDVDGRAGLIAQLRKELAEWPSMRGFADGDVRVSPYYGDDDRCGWKDVHIVTIDGCGVMGFCEGPAVQ